MKNMQKRVLDEMKEGIGRVQNEGRAASGQQGQHLLLEEVADVCWT